MPDERAPDERELIGPEPVGPRPAGPERATGPVDAAAGGITPGSMVDALADLGAVLYQPASPADLRRDPPKDSMCARVRGLMRDFADGELGARETLFVEDHVHGCRSCAVALARAEHEVLRLRRAFALEPTPAPRRGLGRRVLDRVLAESRELQVTPELADAGAPGPFPAEGESVPGDPVRGDGLVVHGSAGGVAAASSVGPRSSSPGRTAARRAVRARTSMLVASTLGAAACLLVLWAYWDGALEVHGLARLSVKTAQDTWRQAGDRRDKVHPGEGLGEGEKLVVGASAEVEWHDATVAKQPAAELLFHGDGEMRLQGGEPLLLNGALEIVSHRRMSMTLADGTRVELGKGRYHIDALGRDRFDKLLASADAVLGVRVEVLEGDPASVLRTVGAALTVTAGEIARYEGNGGFSLENAPTQSGMADPLAVGRDPVQPSELPDLRGWVHSERGPVAGSRVTLSYYSGAGPRSLLRETSPGGEFTLQQGSGIRSQFVIATAMTDDLALGVAAPDAYRVIPTSSTYELARPIYIGRSAPYPGTVLDDATGLGIPGVRLVPCLHDDVFGLLLPWRDAARLTDGNGDFTLTHLPSSLPPHQSLTLLVLHPEYEPAFEPVPLPGSAAASSYLLKVRLHENRQVSVEVPGARELEIWEEVLGRGQGLAPGTLVRVRNLTTQPNGRANVRVGSGRLWRAHGPSHRPLVTRLVEREPGHFAPQNPPTNLGEVFPPLLQPVTTRSEFLLLEGSRYHVFREALSETDFYVTRPNIMHPVVDAQLFFVRETPSGGVGVRFVGIQGEGGPLHFDVESGEVEAVAIGSQGEIGFATPGERRVNIAMLGAVELHRAWYNNLTDDVWRLEFQPAQQGPSALPRPYLRRFATRFDGWQVDDLPPGDYTVYDAAGRMGEVQVQPYELTTLRLHH